MIAPVIGQYAVLEDSVQVFMARILGVDGQPITQATIGSITYTAWDLSVSRTTASTTSTTLSTTTITDTLLLTEPWSADEIGSNWRYIVPGTVFPLATPEHETEFKFVPTSTAQTFFLKFRGSVHEVRMA